MGDTPLKTQFLDLFDLCSDLDSLVSECWANNEWEVQFRRSLTARDLLQWDEMMLKLQNIQLNDNEDEVAWALNKSRRFTTKSLYRFLTFEGVSSKGAMKIWTCKIPLRIKVFL